MFAASSRSAPRRSSSYPLSIASCVWLRPSAGKSRVHSEDLQREEAVIRARFEIYMALPMRKVETMRPTAAIVDEILAALSPANYSP